VAFIVPLLGCPYLGNAHITKKEMTMSNIIPIEFEGHPMRFSDDGWFDATMLQRNLEKHQTIYSLTETDSTFRPLSVDTGKSRM
jgi:hypothetical protein